MNSIAIILWLSLFVFFVVGTLELVSTFIQVFNEKWPNRRSMFVAMHDAFVSFWRHVLRVRDKDEKDVV